MSETGLPPDAAADVGLSSGEEDPMVEHVRWAVATWPQIDPEVEGIVSRVDKIQHYLRNAFRASLGQVGLTKEEWKVVMALHGAVRSHGWLCRDLDVSTGAMTNRLDKLERRGLIRRAPDPDDRRGVLLELTEAGRARLDEYIDAGAARERELLADLSPAEKRELNQLLSKLLISVQRRATDTR
jgi:DNA-binding MarR family transcriptional regulator